VGAQEKSQGAHQKKKISACPHPHLQIASDATGWPLANTHCNHCRSSIFVNMQHYSIPSQCLDKHGMIYGKSQLNRARLGDRKGTQPVKSCTNGVRINDFIIYLHNTIYVFATNNRIIHCLKCNAWISCNIYPVLCRPDTMIGNGKYLSI